MKLEGWMLEWHLAHKHGMTVFTSGTDRAYWHEIDHKFGARHTHEEVRSGRDNTPRPV